MRELSFIPNIDSYKIIRQIAEGISGDDKYVLEKDGEYFLLRIGEYAQAEKSKKEFERLESRYKNRMKQERTVGKTQK